jgi:hypothetical protein
LPQLIFAQRHVAKRQERVASGIFIFPRQLVIGPTADGKGTGEPFARGIFNANLAGVIAVIRKTDDYF